MTVELSIPLSLDEIANATGGSVYGFDTKKTVKRICTDSRECKRNDLFIALKGTHRNGEDFIASAIKVEAVPLTSKGGIGIIVNNTSIALLALAEYYKTLLKRLKYTIAITGSVGKSST